jgi:hypothetical protein
VLAHVIHDRSGDIKSIVFQLMGEKGDLEISPEQDGESVVLVDLNEVIPETSAGADAGQATSRQHLNDLADEIRSGFKLDKERKTLQRIK